MKSASNTPKSAGNLETFANYLGGGLSIGASIGGLTSLINHFKRLNEKAKAEEDTSADDDVLYVNLRRPTQKSAEADELTHMLGMAGGTLGVLGGYAGIKRLYHDFKRKQLQKELDAAQNAYLDTIVPEKSAMNWSQMGDLLFRTPGALAILLGASSGVLADRLLTKNFPSPKAPSGMKPKRLVLRESPDAAEEDVGTKTASADMDDAFEGLLRTVLALPGIEHSELPDLVKAAADGDLDGLLSASDHNTDALFGFAKQAKDTGSAEARELAIGWLVREPEIADAVKLAAALEFAEACPLAMTLGAAADPETQKDLIKLAAEFCRVVRAGIWSDVTNPLRLPAIAEVSKQAYDLTDALRMSLMEAGRPEENLSSGASEDSTDSTGAIATRVEARGSKARALLSQNRDAIDEILQLKPSKTTPKKTPDPSASPAAVAPAF